MEPKLRDLSIDTLCNRINSGGWIIVGGRDTKESRFTLPIAISSAEYREAPFNMLNLAGTDATGAEFKVTILVEVIMIKEEASPHRIYIKRLYLMRQQRSESDGSGSHMVNAPADQYVLANPALDKTEWDAKDTLRKQREAEQAAGLASQIQELGIVGKRIVDMSPSLRLPEIVFTMDDGTRVKFRGETFRLTWEKMPISE